MRLTTLLPHLTGTRKLYVALCGDQIFLNGWTTITALVVPTRKGCRTGALEVALGHAYRHPPERG